MHKALKLRIISRCDVVFIIPCNEATCHHGNAANCQLSLINIVEMQMSVVR